MAILAALIEDWPTAVVTLGLIATVAKLVSDFLIQKRHVDKSERPDDHTADTAAKLNSQELQLLERRLTRLEGQFDALVHKVMDMLNDG